jgi:hypothetical protein
MLASAQTVEGQLCLADLLPVENKKEDNKDIAYAIKESPCFQVQWKRSQ